ncbi:putative 1-deoxy-D-xylulose-5-phosphate synthase [Lyngbya aestuarii BL J]|uniref:Putative 1-deoxy-D-xylulose-5-phosphate synthase n=1 Tax=Lyngbya aestuarii BL J TaxID=1348334 RepID=U7QDS3_9CYAN|nr:hypothetical protein [Lyngbya aestuarii]ERT05160.1 putative 1-deoxy-D-xylulose-5-phosphate synthase [Lyngbya aestuarii BL J]
MGNKIEIGGTGCYEGYEGQLSLADKVRKTYKEIKGSFPKGISLKIHKNSYLYLRWINPVTGSDSSKKCNVPFDESGVYQARDKAWKVKEALDKFETASEFDEWCKREIEGINEIVNDLKTYREIFEEIETEYFNGYNKFTKRPRSREISNDVDSFEDYYLHVFKKFENWDKYPEWSEIKSVLFSWKQGTQTFKDTYFVCKKIAGKAANAKQLLPFFDDIDYKVIKKGRNNQSIDLKTFLDWHKTIYESIPGVIKEKNRNARKSWLWVTSMCALYALRPSEIAAAVNLDKPYTKDGVTIPAINDPNNKTMLLVLDDFTYFGASIKTGGRICKPVTTNTSLINRLYIRDISLPITKSKKVTAFNHNHRERLKSYGCPISQAYVFRHLGNQLGEMYGVPQEIRARSMGHSTIQNDTTYKKRSNFKTTIDILTNHSKMPLSLNVAKDELERLGFDLEDKSVQAILRVIYQLD